MVETVPFDHLSNDKEGRLKRQFGGQSCNAYFRFGHDLGMAITY